MLVFSPDRPRTLLMMMCVVHMSPDLTAGRLRAVQHMCCAWPTLYTSHSRWWLDTSRVGAELRHKMRVTLEGERSTPSPPPKGVALQGLTGRCTHFLKFMCCGGRRHCVTAAAVPEAV
jgi:hypothetical protein